MIKAVENKFSILLDPLSWFYPFLPVVHCLWKDIVHGWLEEQANHSLLHVCSLLVWLHSQELIYLLRRVAWVYELFPKSLCVSLSHISFQDNVTLRVDEVSQLQSFNVVSPLVEKVLDSILSYVDKHSLKESLLEVFVLAPVFERVQSTLHSSLKKPV